MSVEGNLNGSDRVINSDITNTIVYYHAQIVIVKIKLNINQLETMVTVIKQHVIKKELWLCTLE